MSYLIIFISAFLAFLISAFTGGGAGLLLIPLVGFFLSATFVPAALTLGTLSGAITRVYLFRPHIHWKMTRAFVPASIPGAVLGVWVLAHINTHLFEWILGLFLAANLPFLFARKEHYDGPPPGKAAIVMAGFFAGFISATVGAGGLLFNRFYFRSGLDKEGVIATRAANELALHTLKLILYAAWGLLSLQTVHIGLTLAGAAIMAAFLSKPLLKHLSGLVFRRIGYLAMTLSGVIMLKSATVNIITEQNPGLRLDYIAEGIDGRFRWGSILYSIEFRYEEGFEFEKNIRFSELPLSLQNRYGHLNDQYLVAVEKVYTFDGIKYEIYLHDENRRLIRKMTFEKDDDWEPDEDH